MSAPLFCILTVEYNIQKQKHTNYELQIKTKRC